jgi:hypothetical protein
MVIHGKKQLKKIENEYRHKKFNRQRSSIPDKNAISHCQKLLITVIMGWMSITMFTIKH